MRATISFAFWYTYYTTKHALQELAAPVLLPLAMRCMHTGAKTNEPHPRNPTL